MDYCKSIVFVSSKNSRSASCDACRIELPYVRKKDVQNAPPQYRRDYTSIPVQYKKSRVEYMIEVPTVETAADRAVQEFFYGLEYCYTPFQVADRLFSFDREVYEDENAGLLKQINELKQQQEKMIADRNTEKQSEADMLRAEIERIRQKQAEDETASLRAELEKMRAEAQRAKDEAAANRQAIEAEIKRKAEEEAAAKAEQAKREAEELERKAREAKAVMRMRLNLLDLETEDFDF
jgi:DNA repair exonuclease SbcCD ATPase subunit